MSLMDDLEEIGGTVYGLSKILEDDATRDGSDDEKAVLGRFEQGVIHAAIQQMALRISAIAEAMDQQEGES